MALEVGKKKSRQKSFGLEEIDPVFFERESPYVQHTTEALKERAEGSEFHERSRLSRVYLGKKPLRKSI